MPSMGAEYNTPTGLDWDRIRREAEARMTPEQLVAEQAAAEAIRKGANLATARAAANAAVAKRFPVAGSAAEQQENDDDEGAA